MKLLTILVAPFFQKNHPDILECIQIHAVAAFCLFAHNVNQYAILPLEQCCLKPLCNLPTLMFALTKMIESPSIFRQDCIFQVSQYI